MNKETYGALKRIIEEVEEKRKTKCIIGDCIVNQQIGGNDIDLVKSWLDEVTDYAMNELERSKGK